MEKQKNVPVLRFPEFGDEWTIRKFSEVVKINQGLQIAISERITEPVTGSHFYITNEFLKETSQKTYYIKNAPATVLCTKDDILMTRTGNTGMVVTNVEGAFHNNFFKVAYPNYVNKGFLYNFLKLPETQKQIIKLAGTSTIPDLNHSDFYRINFVYPSLSEQTKIANFLTAIDTKIQQLTKKKALLEEYKKGVMQQLFSQQIRFKDNDGGEYPDWEEKKFDEIFIFSIGKNIKQNEASPEFETPCVRYGELYHMYNEVITEVINRTNLDKSELLFSDGDEILLPSAGGDPLDIGSASALTIKDVAIGRTINILKPAKTNVYSQIYVSYYINQRLKKVIATLAKGVSISNVYNSDLKTLEISLPTLPEQTKIANLLTAINAKIQTVAKQIEQTQAYKKGLLQQLFI